MAISIDPMASQYYANLNTDKTANKLETTLSQDMKNKSDEELMEACREFESYFTEQVFKAMEKTVIKAEKEDDAGNKLKDYFKEQLVQTYAEQSAKGDGLGIAKMMYEQMKRTMQ